MRTTELDCWEALYLDPIELGPETVAFTEMCFSVMTLVFTHIAMGEKKETHEIHFLFLVK